MTATEDHPRGDVTTRAEFHARAASSSAAAMTRAMNLSAAGIAGLFALVTAQGFAPEVADRALVTLAGVSFALAIAAGIWNAYSDAQWSFYRAIGHREMDKWHARKGRSERETLALFAVGAFLAALLLVRIVWSGWR